MTDLERFNQVWHFEGQRAKETQEKYEDILFSLWKNHRDWKEEDGEDGFQISCKGDRTIARVRKLAEDAGLLIKVKGHSTGNHTRTYHKNNTIFDLVFRNTDNKYGKWLNDIYNNNKIDIISKIYQDELNNMNIPYVDSGLRIRTVKTKKIKKLNYDIEKLYDIADDMLDHYHSLLLELNNSAVNEDLKLKTYLYFDKEGLPNGRPWSYFCSTLNDKKKHKRRDTSFEYRSAFLNRIELSDYYEVYDIKSEIPRINWLFHTGEWKDDDYDFYSEIIKDTEMMKYLDWRIDRGETEQTEYEDSMKQIFMRIYFGTGSVKQSFNGWLNDKLMRTDNEFVEYWDKEEAGYEINKDIWQAVYNSTNKICGLSIGNLIFWYAFFIETEVKIELLKQGKKVYNVYDGFYFNQDISNEIRELLKVKSKLVYDNYMKVIQI
jgi:hypothetical protein